MPVIDIRNATIFIRDGTTQTTSSTTLSAAGKKYDRKITVSSASGFTVGGAITIGDHHQNYSVVTIDGTTVGITPYLIQDYDSATAVVAYSTNTVEVKIGDGNIQYNMKQKVEYVKDRGRLDTVRLGDDEPLEVDMDFTWEFLRSQSGACPTVEEAFTQTGTAASWVSTSLDPCEPYSVDVELWNVPPCEDYEVVLFKEYRFTSLNHDLKKGHVAIKGTCNNVAPIITHYAGT